LKKSLGSGIRDIKVRKRERGGDRKGRKREIGRNRKGRKRERRRR
jgi:hypothetical protein